MSWWEIVGAQMAAQVGAGALREAAQGESFRDVALEGPAFSPRAHAGARPLGHGGAQPRELRAPDRKALPGRGGGRARRGDAAAVAEFCTHLSHILGGDPDPPTLHAALRRAASEGWAIDVEWEGG